VKLRIARLSDTEQAYDLVAEHRSIQFNALQKKGGKTMQAEISEEPSEQSPLAATDEEDVGTDKAMVLTVDLVRAYVTNHTVPVSQLATLIKQTHRTVSNLANQKPEPVAADVIGASIKPHCIVCLEDGKEFRSLKRHLAAQHGMTPADYRARWNLPPDYPMVAPEYAAFRSELAIAMRLGQNGIEKKHKRKSSGKRGAA
jgi:predicted transcriptional regulator